MPPSRLGEGAEPPRLGSPTPSVSSRSSSPRRPSSVEAAGKREGTRSLKRRQSQRSVNRDSAASGQRPVARSANGPKKPLWQRVLGYWTNLLTCVRAPAAPCRPDPPSRACSPGLFACFVLLGILSMTSDYLLEYIVDVLNEERLRIPDAAASDSALYAAWASCTVIVAVLAFFVIEKLSPVHDPDATGFRLVWTPRGDNVQRKTAGTGGIPELKAHLSGSTLPQWLSAQMYVAKFCGMILTLSSGLLVGKEGPFVHMACIIGRQILEKLPIFKRLMLGSGEAVEGRQHDMLLASAAVGVSSAFRAPIGGVLFSVEMTSASYLVYNYINCFFAAAAGAAMVFLVADHYRWSLVDYDYHPMVAQRAEIPIFIGLGLMSGIVGAGFIKAFRWINGFKRRQLAWLQGRHETGTWKWLTKLRYNLCFTLFTATLTGLFVWPQGQYMRVSMRRSVSDLWTNVPLYSAAPAEMAALGADNWGDTSTEVRENCLRYAATVFLLSLLAINCPVVAGVFTPTMAIGAGLGRAVGEAIAVTWPTLGVSPGGYALVCAASVSAGVTHTISTAVVVIETSGHAEYMLPVLIAVVISVKVSRGLGRSLYDAIAEMNKLPNIQIANEPIGDLVAGDFMLYHPPQLPVHTTLLTLLRLVVRRGTGWGRPKRQAGENVEHTAYACYNTAFNVHNRNEMVAVILSPKEPFLMGVVDISNLRCVLLAEWASMNLDDNGEMKPWGDPALDIETKQTFDGRSKITNASRFVPSSYRDKLNANDNEQLHQFLNCVERDPGERDEPINLCSFSGHAPSAEQPVKLNMRFNQYACSPSTTATSLICGFSLMRAQYW